MHWRLQLFLLGLSLRPVDRDRAHADVYYVDQRLRLLAIATDDDPEELIRGAATRSSRS